MESVDLEFVRWCQVVYLINYSCLKAINSIEIQRGGVSCSFPLPSPNRCDGEEVPSTRLAVGNAPAVRKRVAETPFGSSELRLSAWGSCSAAWAGSLFSALL